jgi:hypothetical protein
MKRVVAALLCTAFGVLLMALPAAAHQPGQTLVSVAYAGTAAEPVLNVVGEITLDQLDAAYDLSLSADPPTTIRARHDQLVDLISQRVSLTDTNGLAWSLAIGELRPSTVDDYVTLRVEIVATPPQAGTSGSVNLRWDVVTDVLYSHKAFIASIDTTGTTQLIGTIAHHEPVFNLAVDIGTPVPRRATGPLFRVGFEHFREGSDHLVFLCLVALGAVRSRTRLIATFRRLAMLTFTFTVGHSISLALASVGWVTPPSRFIETGIAVTIVLAAIHAVKRVVPARVELVITLLFGLIHGFGFAGSLQGLSLHGTKLVVPLLTFNVGLEAAQLLALTIVAWQISIIARSRAARIALSACAGVIAACWIVERAFSAPNPLGPFTGFLLRTPERLAFVLLGFALIVHRRQGQHHSTAEASETDRVSLSDLRTWRGVGR